MEMPDLPPSDEANCAFHKLVRLANANEADKAGGGGNFITSSWAECSNQHVPYKLGYCNAHCPTGTDEFAGFARLGGLTVCNKCKHLHMSDTEILGHPYWALQSKREQVLMRETARSGS